MTQTPQVAPQQTPNGAQAPSDAATAAATKQKTPRTPADKAKIKRRISKLMAFLILSAMIWGAFYVITQTDIFAPALVHITPLWDKAMVFINDPLGIDWGGMLVGAGSLFLSNVLIFRILFNMD